MPRKFTASLMIGMQRPRRFKLGDAPNTWHNPMNAIIERLDKADMTPETRAVIHELLEEFGQHFKDLNNIIQER